MAKSKAIGLQINYKSGRSMLVEADHFAVSGAPGSRRYEWSGMVPDPLVLNADEIESVWVLP